MSELVRWIEGRLAAMHGEQAFARMANSLKYSGGWSAQRCHPLKVVLEGLVVVQGGLKLTSRARWGTGIRPTRPCTPWSSGLCSYKGNKHGTLLRVDHEGPALDALVHAVARWRPLPAAAIAALSADLLHPHGAADVITGVLVERFDFLTPGDRCRPLVDPKGAPHSSCTAHDW